MNALEYRHTKGASNELKAACYFLDQGRYQVYFPVVQQGRVDFVIQDSTNKFSRVQVKTASWSRTGKWKYLQCRTIGTNKKAYDQDFDLLFVIEGDNFWLIPEDVLDTTNISLTGTHPKYKETRWDKYKVS